MPQILRLVEKINRSDLTVLLQGETGTGKTLLAKSIHLSSPRGKGPFVTVDCAALPDNLLESELFGYVKGSFTGAMNDKKGLFEEADGGTIFLDEVGRAGLTVQRRLLHLLDKGEVRPVGSNSYRKLDVRVICATSSKDLRHYVAQGAFIKDLYYRLNDISVVVPSLRDRVEDIPLLADYFLATFTAERAGCSRLRPRHVESPGPVQLAGQRARTGEGGSPCRHPVRGRGADRRRTVCRTTFSVRPPTNRP